MATKEPIKSHSPVILKLFAKDHNHHLQKRTELFSAVKSPPLKHHLLQISYHSSKTRARSTHSNTNLLCYGCGLRNLKSACTLSSPFRLRPFDFSSDAYKAANRVISAGETKIKEIDKAIQHIRVRRAQMRCVIQQHREFVAPVHRLSDSILVLIMEEVSRTGVRIMVCIPQPPAVRAPWTLAAVCSHWRHITLSSTGAHLWGFVNADSHAYERPGSLCQKVPDDLHISRLELQASSNKPIDRVQVDSI
ncbi:hypothetical protein BDV98DRAFT_658182 [Pterulicium gracile]|uniref:F-box domain-containing protein n=1 Tax=Pterulicium gracile TaxID=1884261 RepID=A0A5C3Q7U6_9AGAR|nr:hypothetical protein BDV98DRAFT_658182 [Pterula gracilis]